MTDDATVEQEGAMAATEEQRVSLARRIEDGYHRIDQALARGAEVAAWEDFWMRLLREYEAISATSGEEDGDGSETH